MGVSCKKSTTSNPAAKTVTPPPQTASTNTVNVTITWFYYSGIIPENQMWYSVNNGQHVVLSTNTALSYNISGGMTVSNAGITANVGDIIAMGGPPLSQGPVMIDEFAINESQVSSTQNIENGVVTGTVSDYGHDYEHTSTLGTTTFSFTLH